MALLAVVMLGIINVVGDGPEFCPQLTRAHYGRSPEVEGLFCCKESQTKKRRRKKELETKLLLVPGLMQLRVARNHRIWI